MVSNMDNDFSRAPQTMRPVPVSHPIVSRELIQPKTAAILAGIGVLLFFIGAMIIQSIYFVNRNSDTNYTDYYNLLKNMAGIGRIFNWIGAMIISLPLYITGISNDKLDWKVRASMLSTATAIIVATMVVTMFVSFPTSFY